MPPKKADNRSEAAEGDCTWDDARVVALHKQLSGQRSGQQALEAQVSQLVEQVAAPAAVVTAQQQPQVQRQQQQESPQPLDSLRSGRNLEGVAHTPMHSPGSVAGNTGGNFWPAMEVIHCQQQEQEHRWEQAAQTGRACQRE